jgi:ribonuclease H
MSDVVIDKFSTINKLMDFLSNHLVIPSDDISNVPYVYIDGSYNSETNTWGYGGFLDVNGRRYPMIGQGKDVSKLRNVYGEIMGCMTAVKQAQSLGIKHLVIYYDYNGIEGWAAQNWKAKNSYTKAYKDFITNAGKKIKIIFKKVTSHTGVIGNEIADIMAKFAVGIALDNKQKALWNDLVQISIDDMQNINQTMERDNESVQEMIVSSESEFDDIIQDKQNIIIKDGDELRSIICPNCHTKIDVDESDYQALIKQVRTEEFDSDVNEKVDLIKSQLEAKFEVAETEFKNKIHNMELEHEIALEKAVADKKLELEAMNFKLLNSKNEIDNQRQTFESMLRLKDEQIDYYKDFKAKQSTKMIGESLEQYCLNEFNKHRAGAFRSAYFEKDNEVSKSGSKGDFIFRDSIDNIEYLSIMFEMKNESDTTVTKHKNEEFFKELDKDRREKNCEYAVLVSMLESDNDFYNQGIADVSHRYEKMYVIRPQFFISFITMLRNASMNSIGVRRELVKIQQENFDVVKFMDNLEEFKTKFSRNYSLAEQRFNDAITNIDKTIDYLQKVRDALSVSTKHLSAANKQAQDLTIKKLTRDNPTMIEKFKDADGLL